MSIDAETAFRLEEFGRLREDTGIVFIDDFDTPPPAPPAPAPVVAPTPALSDADIEAARQAGWQDGFAAAAADAAIREADARAALAARLGEVATASAQSLSRLAGEAADAIAASLHHLLAACLPDLCDQHGPREAAAMAAALLPLLTPALAVTARCAPATLPHLSALLTRQGLAGAPVTLAPDSTLAPGDLVLDWENGAARRDTRALLAGLDAALTAIGVRPRAEPVTRAEAVPAKRHERETDYV